MKTINVILEQSKDGSYSAYMQDAEGLDYGVIGTGCSVSDAIEDFKIAYCAIKKEYSKQGRLFTEVDFRFVY